MRIYCVMLATDEGGDVLVWVCSSLEVAQGKIDVYGYPENVYYIKEDTLEEEV